MSGLKMSTDGYAGSGSGLAIITKGLAGTIFGKIYEVVQLISYIIKRVRLNSYIN